MKIVIACMGDALEALTLRQSPELFGTEVSLRLIGSTACTTGAPETAAAEAASTDEECGIFRFFEA